MGESTENIESIVKDYKQDLPEKLEEKVNPEANTLNKEMNRGRFIIGVLENSLELLEDSENERKQGGVSGNLGKILSHHVESGGAGSEALARLIGMGIIEEMPKIQIKQERREFYGKPFIKVDHENNKIIAKVSFRASPPDESGRETWSPWGGGIECRADVMLDLSKKQAIKEYIEEARKTYSEALELKYPDRYNE